MNLDELWNSIISEYGDPSLLKSRPSYTFDSDFYLDTYPDLAALTDLYAHYNNWGSVEGRYRNKYSYIIARDNSLNDRLSNLCTHPKLTDLLKSDVLGIHELVFELIMLGDPIDKLVSDFSAVYYRERYVDINESGIDAFEHFICYGILEGRVSLGDLRKRHYKGDKAWDPSKDSCIICVHEMSRTGAPIVGRHLVKEASETYNVIVLSRKGGELLDDFLKLAIEVVIVSDPKSDLKYIDSKVLLKAKFAILNSVESIIFAPWLVENDVAFCSYIHEYTEYTFPSWKCIWVALFSDLVVFSSSQVRQSWIAIFNDVSFSVSAHSIIIPQAPVVIGSVSKENYNAARSEISKIIGIDCTNKKIVYGAGHIQFRKGTDIFVIASQISWRSDADVIYIWIGDGLNHEDLSFGVWLDKQIREAGYNTPRGNLFFLPAGSAYTTLCKAADCLFLSSRLDPLPNVVFDALEHGCSVVMFDNATGFSDPAYHEIDAMWEVPYADVSYASRLIKSIGNKIPVDFDEPKITKQENNIFESIVSKLVISSSVNIDELDNGDYDVPILYSNSDLDERLRIKERKKIWSYNRDYIWKSKLEAEKRIDNSNNWFHNNIRISSCVDKKIKEIDTNSLPDYHIHLHAYYITDVEEDIEKYAIYKYAKKIIITTDTKVKKAALEEIARKFSITIEVRVVPNKGRDILPFLNVFRSDGRDEDIWCHIHQKESVGSASSGDIWKDFLMRILLGGSDFITSAVDEIRHPEVGLVTAFDPYIMNWGTSQRLLSIVSDKLPGPLPAQPLLFPVGNMFWVKGRVVSAMNSIFPDHFSWPSEPLPNDGSEFHLVERLWVAAAAIADCQSVFLDKKDILRA